MWFHAPSFEIGISTIASNTATMLHGKYRIALHWPDLSMGTFMKIMSTPGDIEDALEAVATGAGPDSR